MSFNCCLNEGFHRQAGSRPLSYMDELKRHRSAASDGT